MWVLAPKKSFPNVFLLFPKWLLVSTNSPVPVCQDVKGSVFCRKVLVVVPMEVLVCRGGLPIQRLLGPGLTKVSKKGM